MVIHLGDTVEFNFGGNLYEAEVCGVDTSASYCNIALDISGFPNIQGTELTKSQYTIYTNVNEYDFAKNSIGKIILWVTGSDLKKTRDGTSKLRIDSGYVVLPPIKKNLQPHEIEEIENKKCLIKFFFKDLQEPYICTNPNSPWKYI
jgi:hypothetical protein